MITRLFYIRLKIEVLFRIRLKSKVIKTHTQQHTIFIFNKAILRKL